MPESIKPKPWETEIWKDGFVAYLKEQRISDRELVHLLMIAARDAEKAFASINESGIGARVRKAQYAQVLQTLKRQQATLWRDIGAVTQKGIEASSAVAAETLNEVTSVLGKRLRNVGGYSLDVAQSFELAAQQGVESVRARAVSKIDFADSVYGNRNLATGKIDRIVNGGLAANKSAREIAKDIRGYIDPNVKGGVDFAAKRLARTEINNAFHTTSVLAAQEQPWVEGVKWNLSGSHPRPDACNDYAEKDPYSMGTGVFPASKVPGKPHPQCLCYTTTITTSDDDFVKAFQRGKYDSYLRKQTN